MNRISIDKTVKDLELYLSKIEEYNSDDIRIWSWPQTWPNGSCGFDTVGISTITTAQTVVVSNGSHAAVAHDGQLAYSLNLKEEHIEYGLICAIEDTMLPGLTDLESWKFGLLSFYEEFGENISREKLDERWQAAFQQTS